MIKRSNKGTTLLSIAAAALLLAAPLSVTAQEAGTPADNAYAAKVWKYMQKNKLIGKDRIQSYPFKGQRPHGSIQEVIATKATIDGHTGRLIVKHNYGVKDGLTVEEVYANPGMNYEALTIMFQRKKGYSPDHNDWFWAEYKASGEVIVHEGEALSGRPQFCIGCHAGAGGDDREVMNGRNK